MTPIKHPFLSNLNCTEADIVTFFENENGRYGTKLLTKENEKRLLNCEDLCVNHCDKKNKITRRNIYRRKTKKVKKEKRNAVVNVQNHVLTFTIGKNLLYIK